ncbi:hypothetical protein LXL04_003090 [Taraxacum kok-saghyz]
MDLDEGRPKFFPVEALSPSRYIYHISSLVDISPNHSRHWYTPGSLALQETFRNLSKFTGTVLLWCSNGSNSNITHKRYQVSVQNNYTKIALEIPEFFHKFSRFAIRQLVGKAKELQFIPALSLAGNLVPPLDNISSNYLAVSHETGNGVVGICMNHMPCEVQKQRCESFDCSAAHAIEPRTGIEFPTLLDNIFGGTNSSLNTEVLVGTGAKTMKIVKIKSLKLYAFGFYVHPYDICNKLGSKYASLPKDEVNKHHNFYADLLREDISMTVRLVVSCNGIKISTVRDAFEKSLRARLIKMNPDTDYDCLKSFGSLFSEDIQIRAGTTIKFQRTADGHLVTEIEGRQIGAVRSRDLCRAFFDMYIGDGPVSEQTKTEIGENVANIMRRC